MRQKAFTLIELLVTMGIIAVLTGMAIFNFNQSRMRARDVQRKSDLGQLKNALELYKIDNKTYPTFNATYQSVLQTGEYTKVTFVDPKGDAWNIYTYTYSNPDYTITACLENTADSTRLLDAGGNSTPCGTSSKGVIYQVTNP